MLPKCCHYLHLYSMCTLFKNIRKICPGCTLPLAQMQLGKALTEFNYRLPQIFLFSFFFFYFSRLLHDRELDLFDGTRLMRWDRYQTLKEQLQFSDQQLKERYTHTGPGEILR